jgi:PAS domain S-box-containing protein/putative nucleotidyltransferase with HDIG domain
MKRLSFRIPLLYLLFGGLWVVFSDRALAWLIRDHDLYIAAQTYKGWAFILVTAALLYWTLSRDVRQIVAQRAARQTSEAQKEKLIQAVEHSGDIIFITDRQGVIEYVNPAFETLTGYSEAEALGQTPRLLQSGQMSQEFYAAMWQTILSGETFRAEVTDRRKNGELFIYEQTITPIKDERGEITHFVSTGKDITERKRLEDSLRESEANLRRAQAVAHIGSWALDLQQNRLTWSDEIYRIFGLPPDTPLTYETFLASVHPDDRAFVDQSWQAALRGAPYSIDHLILSGNEVRWVHEQAEVEFDPQGVPLRALGTVQDITDSKQRLLELEALWRLSQQTLQSLELQTRLENILDIIVQAIPAAEKGTILLADEQDNLRIRAARGYRDPRLLESSFPPASGYSARAFRERRPLLLADVRADPEIRYDGEIEEIAQVQSAIVAPLRRGEKVIGVIALDNVSRKAAFREADLRLLETMASFAASALENARLFEETARRLRHIQALRRIDMAITSSLDLRVTFNVALDEITSQLGIDAAAILLLDPHTLTLDFAAGRGFRTQALQHTHLRLGQGYAGQAALERRILFVSDLRQHKTDFLRSPHFASEGFVSYYAVPLIAKGQVRGVLEIFQRAPMQRQREWEDFLETLAGQTAIAIDNAGLFYDLEHANLALLQAYDATIEGWSRALDLRDKETEGHTQRVTELTLKLARAMGLTNSDLVHIRRGALLHDIGKMGVPDGILLKEGPLTEEEWKIMRQHPRFAYEMLSPIDYLRPALDIPYCHHEKWDGSGYPRGLKGEEIPLAARLFAVVDVYDALTSDRPYRPAWPKEKTLEYIRQQSGSHFDPQVVETFMELIAKQ